MHCGRNELIPRLARGYLGTLGRELRTVRLDPFLDKLEKQEMRFRPVYLSLANRVTLPTNRRTCLSLKAIPDGVKTLGLCTATRPRPPDIRGLRTVLEDKLLGTHAHVGEFSKVRIEAGHRRVFGRRGCRYEAVREMNLRFSIAVQGVEMNCFLVDLNTRTRDEGA
jgi:hypothetical protein